MKRLTGQMSAAGQGLRSLAKPSPLPETGRMCAALDRLRPPRCTEVVPDTGGRAELPLACALGSADGAERIHRWQQLAAVGVPVARLAGHQLEVRYRPGPGVLEELQSLARAEAECCAFAEWAVTDQDGNPTLLVRAGQDAGESVAAIAALFGAA
jgi:hypothetical protein